MTPSLSGRRAAIGYRSAFFVALAIALILLGTTAYFADRADDAQVVTRTSYSTVTAQGLVPEMSSVTIASTVDTYSGIGPIQMGITQGIFRSLGLNVSWIATVNAIQALQGGQVQFALFGPPFAADAAGGTLESVGQTLPNFPAAIIVSPGTTSLSQLSGKTFGCTSSGSLTCVMAWLLMKSQNWTASQSLIKPLGSQTALISALEGGSIQAFIYNWGTALQLQQSGDANVLGDIRTFVPTWYSGTVVVSRDFAQSHPNTVKLFLAGLYQADAWVSQNPVPTLQWIEGHYGLTDTAAQVLYNTTQFSLIGYMQPAEIQFMYGATAQAYGLPAVNLTSTFTNEYVPNLTYAAPP